MPESNDRYFPNANGGIIVREGGDGRPWLVTWLPNEETDPAYPGFTMSSTLGEVPKGPTVNDVVTWAGLQPWANRGPGEPPPPPPPPPDAQPLDVPVEEWAELQTKAFEHHVVVAFTREPDGGYSWGLYSMQKELMQSGMADTWDDARLAVIENLYPPSTEV